MITSYNRDAHQWYLCLSINCPISIHLAILYRKMVTDERKRNICCAYPNANPDLPHYFKTNFTNIIILTITNIVGLKYTHIIVYMLINKLFSIPIKIDKHAQLCLRITSKWVSLPLVLLFFLFIHIIPSKLFYQTSQLKLNKISFA